MGVVALFLLLTPPSANSITSQFVAAVSDFLRGNGVARVSVVYLSSSTSFSIAPRKENRNLSETFVKKKSMHQCLETATNQLFLPKICTIIL